MAILLRFLPTSFASFLTKGGWKLLLVAVLIAAIGFAVYNWRSNIIDFALQQEVQRQLEQTIEEKDRELEIQRQLNDQREAAEADRLERQRELSRAFEAIENDQSRKADGEVAPVLRDTIEALRNREPTGNPSIDEWLRQRGAIE